MEVPVAAGPLEPNVASWDNSPRHVRMSQVSSRSEGGTYHGVARLRTVAQRPAMAMLGAMPRSGAATTERGGRYRRPLTVVATVAGVVCLTSIGACDSTGPFSSACATSGSAYLSSSMLPGAFQVIVDQSFAEAPAALHRLPGAPSIAAVTDWTSGRLVGWIATIAVNGPDRPSENALARSLGESVGRFPLVPLSGPVVEHNPRVLEIYETNDVFSSTNGAENYYSELLGSANEAETVTITENGIAKPRAHALTVTGGDQSFGDETPGWMDPKLGMTETDIAVGVVIGATVVQFTVQGGAALVPSEALGLLNQALRQIAKACDASPPTVTA